MTLVKFKKIKKGAMDNYMSQGLLVFYTEPEWQEHYKKKHYHASNPLYVPKVDFSKQMVIAAYWKLDDLKYNMEIKEVNETDSELEVILEKNNSCQKQDYSPIIITAYCIVKTKKTNKEVIWAERKFM